MRDNFDVYCTQAIYFDIKIVHVSSFVSTHEVEDLEQHLFCPHNCDL